MEEALRYHGILQKMDKQDKIRLIQSLTRRDAQENLDLLFELLGDSIYEFRRAAAAKSVGKASASAIAAILAVCGLLPAYQAK